MNNYLSFIYAGLTEPSGDRVADGQKLARECVRKISKAGDPEHFPPKLFILFATPHFMDFSSLLTGIQAGLADADISDVPLIGSSVAGCIFGGKLQEKGAVLICLASRLLKVDAVVARNAREKYEQAVEEVISRLEFEKKEVPNIEGSHAMIAFVPGFSDDPDDDSYPARNIHKLILLKIMNRVAVFGGVSSMNDRNRAGWQFLDKYAYQDAIVVAHLQAGFLFTSGIWHGLTDTDNIYHVKNLSKDKRTIIEFTEGPADEIYKKEKDDKGFFLFKEVDSEGNMAVLEPELKEDGIRLRRDLTEHTTLNVMKIEPERMEKTATNVAKKALERTQNGKISGLIGIQSRSRLDNYDKMNITLDNALKRVIRENKMTKDQFLAVYMDGEFGLDLRGNNVFGNWTVSVFIFGDEIQNRTVLYKGFSNLAERRLPKPGERLLPLTIDWALDMVWNAGFPGAMLSIIYESMNEKWIVARGTRGKRFKKIEDVTKRQHPGKDVLAIVAEEKKPRFVKDSRESKEQCDELAIKKSGIISQYIIPLLDANQNTLGTLQIDLGDLTYLENLPEGEKKILDSLGMAISSTIDQAFRTEVMTFSRILDNARNDSYRENTLKGCLKMFIIRATKQLKIPRSQIRLYNSENRSLDLITGVGDYYESSKELRKSIDIQEKSPTALAFREGTTKVVNNMEADENRQELRERYKEGDIGKALSENRSYINVVIKDTEGNDIGVLTLTAVEKFNFCQSYVRSLKDLGIRLGLLIDHFKRMESERRSMEDAKQRASELEFIRRATPTFPAKPGIDYMKAIQKDFDEFRKAAKADLCSLFLWDEGLKKFILRAQSGWADSSWVGAARYAFDEGWTGQIGGLKEPRYSKDIKDFYKKINMRTSRYSSYMFSPELNQNETAEAIGIPLRIGDKKLGVLTLHKRRKISQISETGFTTTKSEMLKEIQRNLSSYTASIKSLIKTSWEKREAEFFAELEGLLNKDSNNLYSNLCRTLKQSFQAESVKAYTWDESGRKRKLIAEFPKNENSDQKTTKDLEKTQEWNVFDSNKGKIWIGRKELTSDEENDPEHLALEGAIEKIYMELRQNDTIFGNLEMYWDPGKHILRDIPEVLIVKTFQNIVDRISAALTQRKLKVKEEKAREEEEKSKRAVHAMAAMVFQSAHRWLNLGQEVMNLTDMINRLDEEDERNQCLIDLEDTVDTSMQSIQRPIRIASGMVDISKKREKIGNLIDNATEDLKIPNNIRLIKTKINENDIVYVNADHIVEAIHNIIRNSIKAIKDSFKKVRKDSVKEGLITIRSYKSPSNDYVVIQISDNGIGMTQKEIDTAKKGFVHTKNHKGVGVLISNLLCEANGGSLDIRSVKDSGTEVFISLPCKMEDKNEPKNIDC